jgi:hypothetical protein
MNFFIQSGSTLAIASEHLVRLPVPTNLQEFKNIIVTPNFYAITNSKVWIVVLPLQLWHQLKRYCVLKHQTEWTP